MTRYLFFEVSVLANALWVSIFLKCRRQIFKNFETLERNSEKEAIVVITQVYGK